MAKAVKETFIIFQEKVIPEFAREFAQKVTGTIVDMTAFEEAKKKCEADGKPVKNAGIQMLAQYDYAPEREEFLIKTAQKYIGVTLYDPAQSHTTSPVFLSKLANQIAEMFSFYTMRNYKIPDTEKAQTRLRLAVQQKLFTKLYTENKYIKQQAINHQERQDLRSKPKSVQKKFKQAQQHTKAIAAHNFKKEIDGMFIDAECTPRKRR